MIACFCEVESSPFSKEWLELIQERFLFSPQNIGEIYRPNLICDSLYNICYLNRLSFECMQSTSQNAQLIKGMFGLGKKTCVSLSFFVYEV